MMDFRWVIYRNNVTAEQGRTYADEHKLSVMQAKAELVNETKPKLQYGEFGHWVDVPVEVVWRE